MRQKRCIADVRMGHKGPAVVYPFDPADVWGARKRHFVEGTIDGTAFEGEIGFRRRVFYTVLPDDVLAAAGIAPDAKVTLVLRDRQQNADDPPKKPALVFARLPKKGGGPPQGPKEADGTALAKVKEICLALPDTKLTMTWGSPHFRVMDKIFAGCGEHKGRSSIGMKLQMDHAAAILADPRFSRAPYVGHKGWVEMDASQVKDWDEVRALVHESYELIAPKRSLAKLQAAGAPKPRAADRATVRARRSR